MRKKCDLVIELSKIKDDFLIVERHFQKCFLNLIGLGLLFWWGAAVELTAQPFHLQQFTVEDGLPSSFIYDLTIDQEDFIWLATEGGLSRFDGSRFENNPIATGLTSEVVELEIDSKGILWFLDLSSRIGYYDGAIHFIEELAPSTFLQVMQHKEDLLGNDWFVTGRFILVKIHNDQGKKPYEIKYERKDLHHSEVMIEMPDTTLLVLSNFGVGTFKNYQLDFLPFPQPFTDLPQHATIFEDKVLFSISDELFFYDHKIDSVYAAFEEYGDYVNSEVLFLFSAEGNLWISTRLNGVIFIEGVNTPKPTVHRLLDGVMVAKIRQDRHKGYWLSTLGNGLYYVPNIHSRIIPNKKSGQILTAVSVSQTNKLLLGFDDNSYRILDTNFQLLEEAYLVRDGERIHEIASTRDGHQVSFASSQFCVVDSNLEVTVHPKLAYTKSNRWSDDGQLWIGTSKNAGYLDENQVFQNVLSKRTYAVEPLGDGRAWMGTIEGLYYIEGNTAKYIDHPLLQQDIRDLRSEADGTLWIATLNEGIFLYRGDSIVHHFNTENGLLSNHCRKLLLDDQYAWVATNLGVNQIRLDDFSEIYSIGVEDGLLSSEINDLAKFHQNIVIASNKGLSIFSDTSDFGLSSVHLNLSKIKILERDTFIQKRFDLRNDQNNIKIEFVGVTLRHAENLQYAYQMEGIDEGWVATRLGVAQYPSLPSGKYTFRVRAKTSNAEWSEEKVVHFNIAKAYWEEWWFYLGLVLLAGGFGATSARMILKDYRRRNEIREKLKSSQLIALRARMNPHFLFNALNSIQELIIRNDKRSANRYLAQFSRLMRNILNMSDQDEVTLQTEIESLELYLSLEALRFEKDFEYRFEMEEGLNTEEIRIPSMLLQPYVENAIIHGLMHRRGLKTLFITFKWESPYLVAIVEDNGVGRKRAKEIQVNNGRPHPSTGMGLTKDRLDLLNSTQQDRLSVVVEDLKEADGRALGTQVKIYIALKNTYWEGPKKESEDVKTVSKT